MGEGNVPLELRPRIGECLMKVAKNQKIIRRHGSRRAVHRPVEGKNLALGQQMPQVIVGSRFAQADFKNRSWDVGDQFSRVIEMGSLN
ncbi:MAG: hypothetical protein AAFW76_05240 [Pseudomonadota bacterium]